jgi:hypothetical protein
VTEIGKVALESRTANTRHPAIGAPVDPTHMGVTERPTGHDSIRYALIRTGKGTKGDAEQISANATISSARRRV